MSYDTFTERHPVGTNIDTDNYPPKRPYQCVDYVVKFLAEEGGLKIPGSFGNAWNWWDHPSSKILEICDRIATKDVEPGDVVPLKPIDDKPEHEDGHIVLATGRTRGNEFEATEQNGSTGGGLGTGNDAIRTRWISKDRMVGVYRLKAAILPPAPQSAGGRATRVLVRGDTFWSLEEKLGITHGKLQEWNPNLDARKLPVGSAVFISAPGQPPAPAAQPGAPTTPIVIAEGPAGKNQRWNVRRSPDMGNNTLEGANNQAVPGQRYDAIIDANGWARISFRGGDYFIGPKAFNKL